MPAHISGPVGGARSERGHLASAAGRAAVGGGIGAGRRPRTRQEQDAWLLECLTAAREGSSHGFEVVYRRVGPVMSAYARSLVHDEAEDVTAEAWLQIVRDLDRFAGNWDDFRAWAMRIVRNRALDLLRASARRPQVSLELLADRAGSADTEGAAEESLSTASAVRLINGLPPDQAGAVLLRAVIGLDAASAGRVLGKRPGAVRVAAHRGLKNLAGNIELNRADTA